MPAPPNESPPRPSAPPSAGNAAPQASPQQRLVRAKPESTVTLMIQSSQEPGGLHPAQALKDAAPSQRPNFMARIWAAIKGWF